MGVDDVVVFNEVFADVEVVSLSFDLGIFDGFADGFALDGGVVFHSPVHKALDGVAPEAAEQVVVKGDVEAGFAGITLPAGAAAELVVDAARLVAFGA